MKKINDLAKQGNILKGIWSLELDLGSPSGCRY